MVPTILIILMHISVDNVIGNIFFLDSSKVSPYSIFYDYFAVDLRIFPPLKIFLIFGVITLPSLCRHQFTD
ncbi:hypothetical protein BpHYR1_023697 [Brachionus plicatilis]|uniref:Uncharacterized protein n=1 Tax=Brachionus plicatilis TaxID=10195 RepID=A0A3M7QDK4_BRAPC|nr:hypothetical protein BpHYR1_023697 [Brachionus plicatilis]